MKLFCSLAYLATTNYTAFLRFWLREKKTNPTCEMKLYIWTCFWILCMVSSVFCVCLQPGKKRLHVDQHHPNHHHQAPLFKIHLWFGPYIHDTYIHICISTCEKGSTGHLEKDQKNQWKKEVFPSFHSLHLWSIWLLRLLSKSIITCIPIFS